MSKMMNEINYEDCQKVGKYLVDTMLASGEDMIEFFKNYKGISNNLRHLISSASKSVIGRSMTESEKKMVMIEACIVWADNK